MADQHEPILTDINQNMNLSPDEIEDGMRAIGIAFSFFAGCESLFRDYVGGACTVTELDHLPNWALEVVHTRWPEGKRVQLGQNGLAVLHGRYARCWAFVDDAKTQKKELSGPSKATEEELDRGLVYEPIECLFYRVAMASVAVLIHRQIAMADTIGIGNDILLREQAISFYTSMVRLLFIPAGRTLRNAGSGKPVVANCVVLDMAPRTADNMPILKVAHHLHDRGSGVGFGFHRIEPGQVGKMGGGALGVLAYANEFLDDVETEGRKGANMGVMSVDHPDILDFIKMKVDSEHAIKNFNISVSLSDKFMNQLKKKPHSQWICTFEGREYLPREYVREKDGITIISVDEVELTVQQVFDRIVKCAHSLGEPGCVFLDTVNRLDPSGLMIYACNPCGSLSLPLSPSFPLLSLSHHPLTSLIP